MQAFEKHIIEPKQTLFDLVVQYYGQIDFLFMLMKDNENLKSIDSAINAGTSINIRQDFGNKLVTSMLKDNRTVIATGDNSTILEGIGYWSIEDNFVIS